MLAVVVLAACGGNDAGTGATPSAPTNSLTPPSAVPAATSPTLAPPHDEQALEHFADLLDDEGVLPLDTALALFAATEAPLTGITPFDDVESLPSGVAANATRTVVWALDDLDPAIASDVTAALDLGVDLDTDALIEPGTRFPREVLIDRTRGEPVEPLSLDAMRDRIGAVREQLEALSGHTLSVPIRVRMPARSSGRVLADALPLRRECVVRVFPSAFSVDEPSMMSTIAHEVWHCFQGDSLGRNPVGLPQWIVEGQAEFVGESLVGGSESGSGWYRDWFVRYERALQRRTYDASGVYGVAEESGANPWHTMLPMLGRPTAAALQTLFGGRSTVDAVAAIAQKVTKVPDYGADWDQNSPSALAFSGAEVVDVPLDRTVSRSRTLGTYATFPVVFGVVAGGDIVRLSVTGGTSAAMAAPGHGTVIVAPGEQRDFCIRPDDCLCPDGSWPGGGDPPLASGPGEFAATIGAVGGGRATITAERLDRDALCEENEDNDLVGQWQAPVTEVFAELSRPYGTPPFSCDGPFVVQFGDDLRFVTAFDVTCNNMGVSARGIAELTGTYELGDGTFSVHGATGSGSMEIAGSAMPLPIVDGYRQGLAGPVPYSIIGDQLQYSFTAPDGNTFRFTLTRV